MKYILIELNGGMGNQLFQLSNAYDVSLKFNRQLLICNTNGAHNRGVYWDNVLCKFKNNLISKDKFNKIKINAKIYNWAMTHYEFKNIILEPDIDYYCIEGYYQSYKYFDINIFEKLLTFTCNYEDPCSKSIALHIRRTDYLNNNFHKVLSIDYYYNSLKNIISTLKLENNELPKLYIFSDDINWCKKNFKYQNSIIDFMSMNSDIDELFMMSRFNNIIIGNSSFSWWAAYLNNNNNNKTVYCPKNWFSKNCHLNTKDLRPNNWIITDDDIKCINKNNFCFVKNKFNIISIGTTCCMVQNIHDNVYHSLGPLYRQPDNATNFFDWLISDFRFITYVFENLMFNDNTFINLEKFTFDDINAKHSDLKGGWSSSYRKLELKDKTIGSMISLHDIKKQNNEIPDEFIEKYKRRFERLYNKIINNDSIHLMHCFDFQWLPPYFPLVCDIEKIFTSCEYINPNCKVKIYFFIHPRYKNNQVFEEYKFIDNVELCFLKHKGFHADWKANNLTFDEFLLT
jgi:hypothetical protein